MELKQGERLQPVREQAIVYRDNLFFDKFYIQAFMDAAIKRNRPVRAAFRADDPAFREHALPLSMDALIALAVEEKRALVAKKGYQALPGAVALVRRLAGKVPLAVVSGASRVEVREAVEGIGLTSYFKALLGAEDYGKGKPNPEPFLLGMNRVGASPNGCIVIEDAQPGILAGKAAGMKVIAVAAGNFLGYDQSAADVLVATLEDVTDALCEQLWG